MATRLEQAALDYAAAAGEVLRLRNDLHMIDLRLRIPSARMTAAIEFVAPAPGHECPATLNLPLTRELLDDLIRHKKQELASAVERLELRSRALDEAAGIKPPTLDGARTSSVCVNCGSTATNEELKAAGYASCCPERQLVFDDGEA